MVEILNGSISFGLLFAVALVCGINLIVILGGTALVALLIGKKK